MKRPSSLLPNAMRGLASLAAILFALGSAGSATAAVPNRLQRGASLSEKTELPQGVSKRIAASTAVGPLSSDTQIQSMSLVLAPSAEQAADLDALLLQQQTPGSANYHKWLTPEQFGERFGVSAEDLLTLENWLTSQGFQVTSVARSRNSIQFSGTAALVEQAFSTSMNRYRTKNQEYFENSSAPRIPTAFQSVVSGIGGLSSYHLKPHGAKKNISGSPLSSNYTYTSSSGTSHFLVPYDFRQIYNVAGLYGSGYTGTGISIGIIGQSSVDTSQLAYFQQLTGQTVKAPTLVLVPNTGTATAYEGDEGESEADLEFAGGVAPGATLSFIYTGASTDADVITALEYAITNKSANILSMSYGGCEVSYATAAVNTIEPYFKQANAQGQTIVISSGDAGAASCEDTGVTTATNGLQVSYPASSPYVTAVGGTTFNEGTSGSYWSSTNNSQAGSALGYIPEVAWNDSDSDGLSASGGGVSRVFSKPAWQTGTGVPDDAHRDVPDIAFSASSDTDPYLLCTSDTGFSYTSNSGTTYTGKCTSSQFGAYAVGGTSLATPSFAGLLAIVEQANSVSGLGNINPMLYALRSSNSSVFHDITSGNNVVSCTYGTLDCTSNSTSPTLGYSTTTGYDLVTGLGSIDAGVFSTSLAAGSAAVASVPTVTIALASSTTTNNTYSITVSSNSSSTVPTGTVNVSIDGGTATSVTLTAGVGTYTLATTGLSVGSHTLLAAYTGDSNYTAASSSLDIAISDSSSSLSLSVTPSTVSVTSGNTGNISASLTSTGYSGLFDYTLTVATGSATPTGCFEGNSALSVNAGSTVTTTIIYHSVSGDCTSSSHRIRLIPAAAASVASTRKPPAPRQGSLPVLPVTVAAGLLGGLALRRRKLWMTGLLGLAFTASILGVSGCGDSNHPLDTGSGTGSGTGTGSGSTSSTTYNLILTATSYPSTSISTSANFSITVQ